MPMLDRKVSMRGPKFFMVAGVLKFVNHIDGSTREGPRPATEADLEAHPEAYAALVAQMPPAQSAERPKPRGKAL